MLIDITISSFELTAELYDTVTAEEILNNLPYEGKVCCWGEEIYFNIPLNIALEWDAKQQVEPGELGYWPAGPAFCIFFGPTPISIGKKPKAYSPVNVFGSIIKGIEVLKNIKPGESISVRLHEG